MQGTYLFIVHFRVTLTTALCHKAMNSSGSQDMSNFRTGTLITYYLFYTSFLAAVSNIHSSLHVQSHSSSYNLRITLENE